MDIKKLMLEVAAAALVVAMGCAAFLLRDYGWIENAWINVRVIGG